MRQKRLLILFLFSILILLPIFLKLVAAQDVPYGLSPEEFERRQQELEGLRNQTKWQLLGERWKESLLKNPVINQINGFFERPYVSIIFRVLFGMPWSISITLVFVMALWFLVFVNVGNIISGYSTFSTRVSYAISLLITIIIAQIQVLRVIVEFVGNLIYSREAWWARTILIFVVILILIALQILSKYFGVYLQQMKESKEKETARVAGKKVEKFQKGFEEGEKSV